jgi:hypothetical protein
MSPISFLSTKLAAMGINLSIGIAGFVLSMIWRKEIGNIFQRDSVGFLVRAWIAITACGLAFALVQ